MNTSIHRITQPPAAPPRPEESHKGTFGRVLIVGGSAGMSGAAALAGLGALRGGSGLVFVATPASVQPIVAGLEASYLTIPLPETAEGRIASKAESQLDELCANADAVALGPGVGRSKKLTALVRHLFASVAAPLVVDADALNALADLSESAGEDGSRTLPATDDSAGPRILTPHPGEFARLFGGDVAAVQQRREELAAEYAKRNGVVLVLKGRCTVVTDGTQLAENATGNSGLATGGTGDVLTGLIASMLGQGSPPFEAARFAVWLHGLAADLAAEELSKPGMIASDLLRYLPAAWKQSGGR